MIVDTSSILAIALEEPEADSFSAAMMGASRASLSAATLVEILVVAQRRGPADFAVRVEALLDTLGLDIVPLSEPQARLAAEAHRRYGRGSGHPARLNFGDCFAYALAKETGEPLLCKGDDFIHTDLDLALKST